MKKKLATVMAATMAVSGSVVSVSADTTNEQLVGSNRTDTAVKISKDGWNSAETVILVNDSAIPDALTATPLAFAKNAPILLTAKGGLTKATANEIKRLGAKNVILIGGETVLPAKIENDLKALNVKADRVKGATREETALAIAKRLDGIKDVSEIAVVNGTTGLADAVSVAAAAAEKGMPILLANPKKGLSAAEKFIKDEAIKASFIIGGTTALPEKLVSSLPGKQRIEGSNRNDTNAKVIEKFYGDKELDNLYLAKDGRGGEAQLIDALAVGVLAAKNGAPVLIASKKLNANQEAVVNTKKVDTITQVGGNGNEGAFNHLKEIEKVETIKVKTEAELQEALKKANANDIIEIDSSASISKDVTIATNNAVEINVKGDLKGEVTVKAPNADIKNSGNIGTLVVENGKNTTVTNTSAGKIDKVEVDSSSSNVKVENNGTITQVENNATGTNIENNGTISKPVTGTTTPNVEGNKPGETTKPESGGGGSVSDTTAPGIQFQNAIKFDFMEGKGKDVVVSERETIRFNPGDTVDKIEVKLTEKVKIIGKVSIKVKINEEYIDDYATVSVKEDGSTLVIIPTKDSYKEIKTGGTYTYELVSDDENYITDLAGNKLDKDTKMTFTFENANKVHIVNNKEELETALNDSNVELIKINKTIGSENEYNTYTITRPVTIDSNTTNKQYVYGSFVVDSDDVTIQNLVIENKYKTANKADKNAISVYADRVNIINNQINATDSPKGFEPNGIVIFPKTEGEKIYNISENYFTNYDDVTDNGMYYSAGIFIAEKYSMDSKDYFKNVNGKKSTTLGEGKDEVIALNSKNEYYKCGYDYVRMSYENANNDAGQLVEYAVAGNINTLRNAEKYKSSKATIIQSFDGELLIHENEKLTNNKGTLSASFNVNSPGGIGSKAPEKRGDYTYYDDGAYFRFQVKKADNEKALTFSDVFKSNSKKAEEHDDDNYTNCGMTLQTNGMITTNGVVNDMEGSEREKADWYGTKYEKYNQYKTNLHNSEALNYVFYGLIQNTKIGTKTVGYDSYESRTINMTLRPKAELAAGTYTVTVELVQQGNEGISLGTIDYTFTVNEDKTITVK